ncbi:MAG: hypothetical protein OSA99_11955 [Acidimicrobiales bacterium]|nr:hypothetical protein [Acidimicrobiales bacterium]
MHAAQILAYSDVGTIVFGWGVTAAGVAGYGFWLARRGRSLSRNVAPEDRRWT